MIDLFIKGKWLYINIRPGAAIEGKKCRLWRKSVVEETFDPDRVRIPDRSLTGTVTLPTELIVTAGCFQTLVSLRFLQAVWPLHIVLSYALYLTPID